MIILFTTVVLAASPSYMREQVEGERLMSDMRLLTGVEELRPGLSVQSRAIQHPHLGAIESWLEQRFAEIDGLDVMREPVAHPESATALHNLVAELPGANPDLPPVVLAAHYDSTANLDEAWQPAVDPAPGADDDASGVAAILESARVLASWEPGFERTIRFIAFTAEEVGLVGSTQHVEELVAAGEEVVLMVSLDPVGHNPGDSDILWFSYDARFLEDADRLEALADSMSELSVTGVDADLIGGDARSDHYPFWQAGMPALHVGSFPLPPSYHTSEDTLDGVDPVFLAEVTMLASALASAYAEPLEAPVGGCACSGMGPIWGGWWLGLLVLPWSFVSRNPRDPR